MPWNWSMKYLCPGIGQCCNYSYMALSIFVIQTLRLYGLGNYLCLIRCSLHAVFSISCCSTPWALFPCTLVANNPNSVASMSCSVTPGPRCLWSIIQSLSSHAAEPASNVRFQTVKVVALLLVSDKVEWKELL